MAQEWHKEQNQTATELLVFYGFTDNFKLNPKIKDIHDIPLREAASTFRDQEFNKLPNIRFEFVKKFQ